MQLCTNILDYKSCKYISLHLFSTSSLTTQNPRTSALFLIQITAVIPPQCSWHIYFWLMNQQNSLIY